MRVRTKLVIVGVLPIAVAVLIAVILTLASRVERGVLAREDVADKLVRGVFDLNIVTHEYLQYHGVRAAEQWHTKHDQLSAMLNGASFPRQEDRDILWRARNCQQEIGAVFLELGPASAQKGAGLSGEMEGRYAGQLIVKSHFLVTLASQLKDRTRAEAERARARSNWLVIGATALLAVLIAGTAFFLNRALAHPLVELRAATRVIGRGDLAHRINSRSADEFGDLARAFDRMTERLSNIIVSRDDLAREVAERKRAEDALRHSEKRYRTLVETMNEGLSTIDVEGRITYANPRLCELLGRPAEDVIGRPGADFVDEINKDILRAQLEERRLGRARPYELTWLRRDGAPVRTVVSPQPVYDEQGAYAGSFATVTDISEIQRAQEAIRASERKYRMLLDNLPQKVFFKDRRSTYVSCNPSYARDLHIEPAAIVGKTDFDFYPADLAEKYRGDDERIMAAGKAEEIEERYLADGEEFYVQTVKTPIEDEDGKVVGILGIFWDITLRKRAEEELQAIMKELERSNRDLEQFAYVASHDLQEPLRMVASFVQLLAKRYRDKLDADADEFIGFAVDGANRMQRMINDLLAYSRVGTHGKPLTATDLEKTMGHVLANLKAAIDESGAEVTHDPLPTVNGDESQVMQLFQNLIGNAIKFRGDEPPRIHVGVRRAGGGWVFSVRDNGIGIDPKQFERVFMIFQRLHTAREYPGSGIGLALCKKIVERHGGRIWLESEPGKGSTFHFTMPVARKETK